MFAVPRCPAERSPSWLIWCHSWVSFGELLIGAEVSALTALRRCFSPHVLWFQDRLQVCVSLSRGLGVIFADFLQSTQKTKRPNRSAHPPYWSNKVVFWSLQLWVGGLKGLQVGFWIQNAVGRKKSYHFWAWPRYSSHVPSSGGCGFVAFGFFFLVCVFVRGLHSMSQFSLLLSPVFSGIQRQWRFRSLKDCTDVTCVHSCENMGGAGSMCTHCCAARLFTLLLRTPLITGSSHTCCWNVSQLRHFCLWLMKFSRLGPVVGFFQIWNDRYQT